MSVETLSYHGRAVGGLYICNCNHAFTSNFSLLYLAITLSHPTSPYVTLQSRFHHQLLLTSPCNHAFSSNFSLLHLAITLSPPTSPYFTLKSRFHLQLLLTSPWNHVFTTNFSLLHLEIMLLPPTSPYFTLKSRFPLQLLLTSTTPQATKNPWWWLLHSWTLYLSLIPKSTQYEVMKFVLPY